MTGLDRVRACMTDLLLREGVEALEAWPGGAARRPEGPVAAVSLRACEGGPGGFQDYLGERYDEDSGRWLELYGRRLRVVFGLDLYAPGPDGAAACQTAFDKLAGALNGAGPAGLRVKELSRGEVCYDQALELFRCPVEAVCETYLYAAADEAGTFLDFMVKGEANGTDKA